MAIITMMPGGAGKKKETALWTNPNPNNAQSGPTITLSDDLTNYDGFAIEFKDRNTDVDTLKAYYDAAPFSFNGSAVDKVFVGAHDQGNNRSYVRRLNMTAANTIIISEAYRLNNSGSANSYAVVVAVYGLK